MKFIKTQYENKKNLDSNIGNHLFLKNHIYILLKLFK